MNNDSPPEISPDDVMNAVVQLLRDWADEARRNPPYRTTPIDDEQALEQIAEAVARAQPDLLRRANILAHHRTGTARRSGWIRRGDDH